MLKGIQGNAATRCTEPLVNNTPDLVDSTLGLVDSTLGLVDSVLGLGVEASCPTAGSGLTWRFHHLWIRIITEVFC